MKKAKIPPLGAKPRFVREQERILELQDCFARFFKAYHPLPLEFVEEYNELVGRLPVED